MTLFRNLYRDGKNKNKNLRIRIMAKLDPQTVILVLILAVFGYWVFNRAADGSRPEWGPLAGSGPGIQPDVYAHSCPSVQQQRKREAEVHDVQPYNPSSSQFASVA